jgi:hypothetical protein
LYLQVDAPPEAVKAAYRALAKGAHPDAGGDHEAMTALTIAYETALDWSGATASHLILPT